MSEERGESDTVISSARLFAERDESVLARNVVLDELLTKAMTHHSVANDDEGLARTGSDHGTAFGTSVCWSVRGVFGTDSWGVFGFQCSVFGIDQLTKLRPCCCTRRGIR